MRFLAWPCRCAPAAEMHLSTVKWVEIPAIIMFIIYMHEMHQRNGALCVMERPCVLNLPVVFIATRLAVCSGVQMGVCVLCGEIQLQGRVDSPPPPCRPQASVFLCGCSAQ
ncbi:hypothetical protein ILYODFUR_007104 [Ilyodon furcidens]|uniref:Uncharacterized protein n=1 Tax=Ilyodon furcidens TaxID=33524 RepID=A0ABV0UEH4_9TELE